MPQRSSWAADCGCVVRETAPPPLVSVRPPPPNIITPQAQRSVPFRRGGVAEATAGKTGALNELWLQQPLNMGVDKILANLSLVAIRCCWLRNQECGMCISLKALIGRLVDEFNLIFDVALARGH